MSIHALSSSSLAPTAASPPGARPVRGKGKADQEKLRATFQSVVGETLFGQTLKSMRKTVGKGKYFHGGRAEEVFQQQLDHVLAEKMSRTSAETLSQPAFELFTMGRK